MHRQTDIDGQIIWHIDFEIDGLFEYVVCGQAACERKLYVSMVCVVKLSVSISV